MIRGSHNCGECDEDVATAIERYSVSADIREFDGINCHCKEIWENEIRLDRVSTCH